MATDFSAILDEFVEELRAIDSVAKSFSDPSKGTPRARVAAANASTLLLAATFEEFVREMARAFARSVVQACGDVEKLPPKLVATAWRRTMEALARLKFDPKDGLSSDVLARFNVVYDFCKGDLAKDVYRDLIHNENNMRPVELNGLFKLSGLRNVCLSACDAPFLLKFFEEEEANAAHGLLLKSLDEFFDRRNAIAHSVSTMQSRSPEQISKDMELLAQFARALCATIEANVARQ